MVAAVVLGQNATRLAVRAAVVHTVRAIIDRRRGGRGSAHNGTGGRAFAAIWDLRLAGLPGCWPRWPFGPFRHALPAYHSACYQVSRGVRPAQTACRCLRPVMMLKPDHQYTARLDELPCILSMPDRRQMRTFAGIWTRRSRRLRSGKRSHESRTLPPAPGMRTHGQPVW